MYPRPLAKSAYPNDFLISQPKHTMYVMGAQKNHLNETVLLSTQNTYSNKWISKYLQL